jgi:hypothetical protein
MCEPSPSYSSTEQVDAQTQLWSLIAPVIFKSSLQQMKSSDNIDRQILNIPYNDPTWRALAFVLYLGVQLSGISAYETDRVS